MHSTILESLTPWSCVRIYVCLEPIRRILYAYMVKHAQTTLFIVLCLSYTYMCIWYESLGLLSQKMCLAQGYHTVCIHIKHTSLARVSTSIESWECISKVPSWLRSSVLDPKIRVSAEAVSLPKKGSSHQGRSGKWRFHYGVLRWDTCTQDLSSKLITWQLAHN